MQSKDYCNLLVVRARNIIPVIKGALYISLNHIFLRLHYFMNFLNFGTRTQKDLELCVME